MGRVVNTGLCSVMAVFCDGCVLGVFVVCTIVQAGSSVCTHRQVGPERRRGGGQCRAVLGTTSTLVLPHKDQLHNNQALISGVFFAHLFHERHEQIYG